MKEFKVNVTPMLKKLELVSKKHIAGSLSGEFISLVKGSGLEFRGFRVYNPGQDDAKNIDWKTSLRSRSLLVKELVEERNNSVMFLVDVSSTMSFGSTAKLKNEYVIEMVASIAYSFIQGGDSVGLTLFSDHLVKHIPPNIGSKQFYMMLKTLTNPEYYEGPKDLGRALHDLNVALTGRSIIIVISDFLGMSDDSWLEEFKQISAKHEVIAFVVKDPRDMNLPPEVGPVFVGDPLSNEDLLIDTKNLKEPYERYARSQNDALESVFKRTGVDHLFVNTTEVFSRVLLNFFKARARQ